VQPPPRPRLASAVALVSVLRRPHRLRDHGDHPTSHDESLDFQHQIGEKIAESRENASNEKFVLIFDSFIAKKLRKFQLKFKNDKIFCEITINFRGYLPII
jgi:hypothetical protein